MVNKYYESKTPAWQRWVIWIIAIAMAGGTIVGLIIAVMATENTDLNAAQIAYNKYLENYEKQLGEEQAKQDAIVADYVAFDDAYQGQIAEYASDSVPELKVTVLKEGDGDVVSATDTISANYTGWTSDGKIFDTTRKTADAETTPVEFSLSGVISGWTQGLSGQKVGGVYLLEIPQDLAYGDVAATYGYPEGALKFIVEIKAIV